MTETIALFTEEQMQAKDAEIQALRDKQDELKAILAEAYQVIGHMAEVGGFADEDVFKILDNLAEERLKHTDVLPFDALKQGGGE